MLHNVSEQGAHRDNGSVQCSFETVGIFKVRIRTGFAAGGNDPTQQLVTVLSRGTILIDTYILKPQSLPQTIL